jgi:hypothetical protein
MAPFVGRNFLTFLVKQRVKQEIVDDLDDSDSEYSRIHAGFDLLDSSIVSLLPRSLDNRLMLLFEVETHQNQRSQARV